MTAIEFLVIGKFDGEGGAIIFNNDFYNSLSKSSKAKKINYNEEFKYSGEVVIILFDFGYFNNATRWIELVFSVPKEKTWVYFHRVFRNNLFKSFASIIQNFLSPHSEASLVIQQSVSNAIILDLPHGVNALTKNPLHRSTDLLSIGYKGRYKNTNFIINKFKDLQQYKTRVVVGSKIVESKRLEEVNGQLIISQGYFSNEEIENFLLESRIAIFHYEDVGEDTPIGASGIARLAATKGCLVMINSHPMFSDLQDDFLIFNSDLELEVLIEKYLNNAELVSLQLKRQELWVANNQWDVSTERLITALSKL